MGAHKPEHPYHLVNPSPWPILGGFSLLLLTFGATRLFHEQTGGSVMVIAGLSLILYCMFVWWRDVIKEAEVDKAHSPVVAHGLRLGMGLFILSEVAFFVAFFWAFFHASLDPKLPLEDTWAIAAGVWPPEGIETFSPFGIPLLNTLILLLSGTTVTWAHHAILNGDRDGLVKGLGWTVGLGVIFTALQAYEYSHAAFGYTDGIYASTFYMATGFHGFHVIVGTIFLAVCWVRAKNGHFTADRHLGLEFAAWYWHFVDVVWLFLFVAVYGEIFNAIVPAAGDAISLSNILFGGFAVVFIGGLAFFYSKVLRKSPIIIE